MCSCGFNRQAPELQSLNLELLFDDGPQPIGQCSQCKIGNVAIRQHHKHLNLLMSRLDEQQRRWMAAMEAKKLGHGGIRQVQKITELDINTIRRGRSDARQ